MWAELSQPQLVCWNFCIAAKRSQDVLFPSQIINEGRYPGKSLANSWISGSVKRRRVQSPRWCKERRSQLQVWSTSNKHHVSLLSPKKQRLNMQGLWEGPTVPPQGIPKRRARCPPFGAKGTQLICLKWQQEVNAMTTRMLSQGWGDRLQLHHRLLAVSAP